MSIYYEQASPWQSNQERLVSEALASSQTPGELLAAEVRPPLPQIIPFRPRFGYESVQERQVGVQTVLGLGRGFADRHDFTSGGPGYQGSSRNVQSNGEW